METLRWQAELANRYDIYGMCFYHYWFKDGKMLLQKPAELWLANKDRPMRICFSWANEPWARTWDGRNKDVLMPQEYGGEEDWRKHFEYLLPFFQDERFIKVDGRPMFLLYRAVNITRCKEMMEFWESLAQKAGLPGMHFVSTLSEESPDDPRLKDMPFRAFNEFEPYRSIHHSPKTFWQKARVKLMPTINKLCGTHLLLRKPYPFSYIARLSLDRKSVEGTYGGIFCAWDNSPRKTLACTIVETPTRDELTQYVEAKVRQTLDEYKTDFVFVNAWNEWAEGTYLEPDTDNKYMYLECLQSVIKHYQQ